MLTDPEDDIDTVELGVCDTLGEEVRLDNSEDEGNPEVEGDPDIVEVGVCEIEEGPVVLTVNDVDEVSEAVGLFDLDTLGELDCLDETVGLTETCVECERLD